MNGLIKHHFILLASLLTLGAVSPALAADATGCDRQCLESFAGSYFEAMRLHDPTKIAGSGEARYTENTVDLKAGQGLWATFSGLGSYRIFAADPDSGQVVFMGTIRENGTPAILALRLKVGDGALHEAEAIVHRQPEEAKSLEGFGKPEAIWSTKATQAALPDSLARTAGLYFKGLLAHDGHLVPFSSDCNRIVDGEQDTNNPKDRSFLFGTYNPAALSCTDNLSSPVWSYQASIEPRRFAMVDSERGLVFVVLMFNHPGNVTSADVPGVGKVPMPAVVMRPSTVQIADLFKVEDGKISRLQAVSVGLPYMHPDAWSTPSASAGLHRASFETTEATLNLLARRAEVEDMLSNYYALFSRRSHEDFSAYYTEDGVLDANGIVRKGRDPINALYKSIGEEGNIHILVSNPRIQINGDTATADLTWTEIVSKNHAAIPQIVEQGREHDQLVRRNGRWYFTERLVTNDGGLPAVLEKSYKER